MRYLKPLTFLAGLVLSQWSFAQDAQWDTDLDLELLSGSANTIEVAGQTLPLENLVVLTGRFGGSQAYTSTREAGTGTDYVIPEGDSFRVRAVRVILQAGSANELYLGYTDRPCTLRTSTDCATSSGAYTDTFVDWDGSSNWGEAYAVVRPTAGATDFAANWLITPGADHFEIVARLGTAASASIRIFGYVEN